MLEFAGVGNTLTNLLGASRLVLSAIFDFFDGLPSTAGFEALVHLWLFWFSCCFFSSHNNTFAGRFFRLSLHLDLFL